MKKLSLILVTILIVVVKRAEQVSFDDFCSDLRTYEKAFSDDCTLVDQNIYANLMKMVAFVQSVASDSPDKSVHDLLSENLFTQTLSFFKATYKDEADYIAAADELVDELNKVLNTLKSADALSSTKLSQVYAPFQISGFSAVASQIKEKTDKIVRQQINALPDNATDDEVLQIQLNYTCSRDNTFCGNTQRIFGLTDLALLADVSLKQFLLDSNQNLYKSLNRIQYLNQFETVNAFINEWDQAGTEKTTVSQLFKILDLNYMRAGFYIYEQEDKRTTVRKTRTSTTTVIIQTTKEMKVTNETAVSEVVYIVTPSLMLFVGAIAAVAIAYVFYKFRPVPAHFPSVESSDSAAVMEKYSRQQDIELNKINEKNIIRF